MPEGHTIHRIALQLGADLVGRPVAASSPQGRFAAGAALLDGRVPTAARAHGKQFFLDYDDAAPVVLRVHLGLYGAWDLRGAVTPLTEVLDGATADGGRAGARDRLRRGSLGAPRRAVRLGETEGELAPDETFPPEPVGQVRLRLATDTFVADLRGPAACVESTPEEAAAVVAAAGPDPRAGDPDAADRFVALVRRTRTGIGRLLMDQAVAAGVGNIYRAELLFRAGLDPHVPGRDLPEESVRALGRDWVTLLDDGVATGAMVTRAGAAVGPEPVDPELRARALADRAERYSVYGRDGLPCLRCGMTVVRSELAGRSLFHCPGCQR